MGLSWLIAYLGVAAALGILLVLRRPGIVFQPQFWAEDGAVFFRDNTVLGFWASLSHFYIDFPYLLHRLLAKAAVPFGIGSAPLVYGVLAVSVASLAIGSFVLPYYRHVVANDYLRVLFCVSVVALPESWEVVGIVANVQWYLAVWALVASLIRLPRSRWGVGLLCLAYGICIFSAPLALLAVPIWLLRLVRSFLSRNIRESSVALAVLCAAGGLLIVTRGSLGARGGHLDLAALLNFVTARVITQCLLGAQFTSNLGTQVGYWSAYVVSVVAVLVVVVLAALGRFRSVPVLALCCYGLLGSLILTLLGRDVVPGMGGDSLASAFFILERNGSRYFLVSLAMVCLAFLAAIDRLPSARGKVICSLALAAVLALSFSQTFAMSPLVDYPWNRYAAELSHSMAQGDGRLILIPINPPGWGIEFNPLGIPPEVPTEGLVRGVTIEQTFTARCNGLDRIELRFVSHAATDPGPVTVTLRGSGNGKVMARTTVTPVVVDPPWREIRFTPIPNSKDGVFVISLASPSGDRGHAMTVWQSVQDLYAGGQMLVNGKPVGADLAFGYGCGV